MDNSKLKNAPGLPPDAEARVILEARKEGVFAGLTSGLASGEHLPRHEASRVMICDWVTSFWLQEKRLHLLWRSGVLAGYFFTKAFKDTALAQLRAEEARLRLTQQNNPEFLPNSTQNNEP